MQLAAIVVYPLKGARGIALAESRVLRGGLLHDRRFMLVGEDGVFLSQRTTPRLALVRVRFTGEAIEIGVGKGSSVVVPLAPRGPRRTARVWRDDVLATEASDEASAMLSEHLGQPCTLVHMPDDVIRPVDPRYASPTDRVGFADGFPVLVASLASLADLNARLEQPVTMDRFRPNLVLAGGEPYGEERFPRVRVGEVVLRLPKRCGRCKVTTIDQGTGEQGEEPLRTLATYRREGQSINFAMNAIPDDEGVVRVGDRAELLPA